ncbi:tail fiber domain-containing protein [Rhodocytophaga aerolata]|uniref:Tail fiber domain-containing protein n=1 Tax=Rhodocytophaga aerolata TaxID=455078 RepID=A0ABT8RDI3_9BACT|nr:tail fiber domain-containing protein [Rhodocytophaga aerolata]MDO1450152.1 tail fiber domain-containing protein [Rhodocytophaga aerolata]
MKKRKIVFAALLLCAATFSANAQWSLTGNTGTNSSTNFIGTRDSRDLTFRTNNIPRMYISSYGGVGIIDPGSNPNSNSHPILLYFQKTSPGPAIQIGMQSTTNASPAIYAATTGTGNAIWGSASQAGSSGVYGVNSNGYGLQGNSYSSYGLVTRSTNYYGMVAIGQTYAAYFVGGVFASNGYHAPSDQKLKQNIEDVTSARDIISQLHPKKYYYRQDGHHKLMKLPHEQQYGLLAQEVEKVLPGLVKDTKFEPPLEAAPTKMGEDGKFDLQTEAKAETVEFKAVNYVGSYPDKRYARTARTASRATGENNSSG